MAELLFYYYSSECRCVYNQISKDDGIRPGTTMEALTRLKPAFKEDGSTTAGKFSADDATVLLSVGEIVLNDQYLQAAVLGSCLCSDPL